MYLACIGAGLWVVIYEGTRHVPAPALECTVFLSVMLITDAELTALIVGRFIYYRRLVGDNPIKDASEGSNAVMIWIQSAVLSESFGVVFLIMILKANPMAEIFLVVQGQVNGIATALVMLRVAWSKNQTDRSMSGTTANPALGFGSTGSRSCSCQSCVSQTDVIEIGHRIGSVDRGDDEREKREDGWDSGRRRQDLLGACV